MKRSRLLLVSVIFILLAFLAAVPLVYGAQNLSASSVSELNGLYVNGGSTYDAFSDGDICFVFKAGSDREFILYLYDDDSGQTEDSDMYINPDYYSSGRSYTGTGRWVKMSVNVNNLITDGDIELDDTLIFEGSTEDAYETTFSVIDPNADRTITVPNSDETIGVATSITDDLITKADFADEDWGDMSVLSNSVTLDNDIIDPNHMADADHGVFSYSDGEASFDTNVVDGDALSPDAVDISTHTNLGGTSPISISGDSVTIADAAADDSTKGAATFEEDDFDSASGKIDLEGSVCKSISSDSGSATPSTHGFTIAGGDGITTSGTGSTITVTNDLGTSIDASEIDANAVGSSEIAPNAVGASEISTDAVGDEEIDYSAVTLADFDYQTAYRTFYSDASGDVQELAHGADGKALISNGASADPDWEYLPRQNLLSNTQWIACFNSDTDKGIGAMTFDAGFHAAPTAGLAVTGSTSGATGKLMTCTLATGEWDANTATGTMTLGSCSGRFHDDEPITWTGGYATVNHPNSAAGVDLIQNGELSVDTDPPPGWTAGNAATLSTEAGGKVGNCLMITCDGTNDPYAYQRKSVTAGKNYYYTNYAKAGTEATYVVVIRNYTNSTDIYHSGSKEETAGDWSTSVQRYFVAPFGCTQIEIRLFQIHTAGGATTIYFDEISCYEVTPGFTGADALAFDGIWKDSTLDLYRYHDGSTDGSFYSAMSVPTTQNDFFAWPKYYDKDYFYVRQQGRTITMAGYVNSSTASDIKAFIYDGAYSYSSAHTGGSTQEWLEVTDTISSTATNVHYGFIHTSATPGIAYISEPIAVYGSSIGAGNYVPEANKVIYAEKEISSQTFNNKTGTSGFSDISATELNLEADSLCCLGKGVKAVLVSMSANDVASAGTDVYFTASYDLTYVSSDFKCQPYNLTNDVRRMLRGFIGCNASGNYEYQIEASGGSTFDIPTFKYVGIEW